MLDAESQIVLVAIDGVAPRDVFLEDGSGPNASLVPTLASMHHNGASWGDPKDDDFRASGPNYVSLPGYMEMLSGTSDLQCTENDCPFMLRETLIDDFMTLAHGESERVAAFSSWPVLEVALSKNKVGVVSAGQTRGRNLEVLRRWGSVQLAYAQGQKEGRFGGGFRDDEKTADLALQYLAHAQPQFLFIGLGETDEFGHLHDRKAYLNALKAADSAIARIREQLVDSCRAGRKTLLIVTTDHGRSHQFVGHGRDAPESGRSFLLMEGLGLQRDQAQRDTVYYLKDIAPTLRHLASLESKPFQQRGVLLPLSVN